MQAEDSVDASDTADIMAAVDLGSNSFHMVVARLRHGQLVIVDRLREMVRLASGLQADGSLDRVSQKRALRCLRRFGQRIRAMHAERVRVVGTNTLRRVKDGGVFLKAAEAALGQPVEVIAGIEEARLIYQGVVHSMPAEPGGTLVLDIGGGSTELIVGRGYQPERLESLFMGCVGLSQRFFADGELSMRRFEQARLAARLELRPVKNLFRGWGWERAVGSSGTILAADRVAQAAGVGDGGLDARALDVIVTQLIAAGNLSQLNLPGLSRERAPVFPGGIAILVEILQTLGIEKLDVSDGALREGLLYDMLGRLRHEDPRERTVRAMRARYSVDGAQAERVAATARQMLLQVQQAWNLTDTRYHEALDWAAQLHEIGLDIAHSKYHEHGAYLLKNADLPGFVRQEQLLLATLLGGHRRRLIGLTFDGLSDSLRDGAFKLLVLLRLAVLLHRSRTTARLPQLKLRPGGSSLDIAFPAQWLGANPLTLADLSEEQAYLAAVGFELTTRSD